jgi:hypothetical protein
MDMTLAMTQGFHNAPKLYGDSTVRQMHQVTGSGQWIESSWQGTEADQST